MQVGRDQRPQPQEKPHGQNDRHHPVIAGRHAGGQGFLQRQSAITHDTGGVKGQKIGRPANKDQRPHRKPDGKPGRPILHRRQLPAQRKPVQRQHRRADQHGQRQRSQQRVRAPVDKIDISASLHAGIVHVPAGDHRQREQCCIAAAAQPGTAGRALSAGAAIAVQRGCGSQHCRHGTQFQLVTGQKCAQKQRGSCQRRPRRQGLRLGHRYNLPFRFVFAVRQLSAPAPAWRRSGAGSAAFCG